MGKPVHQKFFSRHSREGKSIHEVVTEDKIARALSVLDKEGILIDSFGTVGKGYLFELGHVDYREPNDPFRTEYVFRLSYEKSEDLDRAMRLLGLNNKKA